MGDIPIVSDVPASDPGLGFAAYARALADAIRGGTPPQFTIGIYGPWGSGKTSLLLALRSLLARTPRKTVPVFFDAWRFERSGPIVVPLLHRIMQTVEASGNRDVAEKIRRALNSLLFSLNLNLGGVIGVGLDKRKWEEATVNSLIPALEEAFAAPFNQFREIPKLLKGRRIVVLIDDLDRCSADNIVGVLESINLVLDVKGFVFVLALDYEILVEAITRKYPHAPGHAFIEKMVQVPFRVPRLRLTEENLAELIPNWHKHIEHLPQDFPSYAHEIATLGLEMNPRQIKRFLNSFLVLHRLAAFAGDYRGYRLLAALIGLQLRWPTHYRALADATIFGEEDPFELLAQDTAEPALRRYAMTFFDPRPTTTRLRQLLQLSETVTPETARDLSGTGTKAQPDVVTRLFVQTLQQMVDVHEEPDGLYYDPNRTMRVVVGRDSVDVEIKRSTKGGETRWQSLRRFPLSRHYSSWREIATEISRLSV
jgi:hypothetical protein